jgi:hypothetical protein
MNNPTLWYYHRQGRGFGPVEEADIRRLLEHNDVMGSAIGQKLKALS